MHGWSPKALLKNAVLAMWSHLPYFFFEENKEDRPRLGINPRLLIFINIKYKSDQNSPLHSLHSLHSLLNYYETKLFTSWTLSINATVPLNTTSLQCSHIAHYTTRSFPHPVFLLDLPPLIEPQKASSDETFTHEIFCEAHITSANRHSKKR